MRYQNACCFSWLMPSTCQLKLLAGVAVSKVADELSSTSAKIAACDCKRKASVNSASKTQSSARTVVAEKNRDVLVIRHTQREGPLIALHSLANTGKTARMGGKFSPRFSQRPQLPRNP